MQDEIPNCAMLTIFATGFIITIIIMYVLIFYILDVDYDFFIDIFQIAKLRILLLGHWVTYTVCNHNLITKAHIPLEIGYPTQMKST